MMPPQKLAVWLFVIAFICLVLVIPLAMAADSGTSCEEWGDFTKIITYKFRDQNFSENDVKDELAKVMNGHPELDIALKWVNFTYTNKQLNPVQIWTSVYDQCRIKASI